MTSQRIEDASAVIEAITEQPDLKSDVHAKIAGTVRPGTPVISNTSGIPIDEMASALPCPEDIIGTTS